METVNGLKHEIQTALVDLRTCEAALRQGEKSPHHEAILRTIERLEKLLKDQTESHTR